jgi:uncharacterized protein
VSLTTAPLPATRALAPHERPSHDIEFVVVPGPRPLAPRVSQQSEPFWTRLAGGVFGVAHCEQCGRLSFPPKANCPDCGASGMGWQPVSGDARVYSATVVHAAPALFAAQAPYALVVVDLAEGVRLVTRWVGTAPPRCDQPARLVVLKHDDGVLFGAKEPT